MKKRKILYSLLQDEEPLAVHSVCGFLIDGHAEIWNGDDRTWRRK